MILANVKKLKTIKIRSRETLFWRYQQQGKEFLATIEGPPPLVDIYDMMLFSLIDCISVYSDLLFL